MGDKYVNINAPETILKIILWCHFCTVIFTPIQTTAFYVHLLFTFSQARIHPEAVLHRRCSFKFINDNIIGKDASFKGPFGEKRGETIVMFIQISKSLLFLGGYQSFLGRFATSFEVWNLPRLVICATTKWKTRKHFEDPSYRAVGINIETDTFIAYK